MKKLLIIISSLTFLFVGMANKAEARKRMCYANYLNPNGTRASGWKALGKVGGVFRNKKRLCRAKAKANCARYAKGRYAKSLSLCGKYFTIYADTKVQGKRNSKDTNCRVYQAGYKCYGTYYCPRGYKLRGRYCYKRVASWCKACNCRLKLRNGKYGPYTAINGYLYTRCIKTSRIPAKHRWTRIQ